MSPRYACLKGNLYQAAEQKAQIAEFETRNNTATKDTHDGECTEETQCLNGSNNDHNAGSFLTGVS